MRTHEFSEYEAQLSSLAWKGLNAHASKDSQLLAGGSITAAVSAAKLMVVSDVSLHDQLTQGLSTVGLTAGKGEQLTDPAGHRRPIYLPLAFHLLLCAWQRHVQEPLPAGAREAAACMKASLFQANADGSVDGDQGDDEPDTPGIDVQLWECLCLYEFSLMTADEPLWKLVVTRLGELLAKPGSDGSLHIHDPADSLDAWTYRELVGLHALFHLANLLEDDVLKKRCSEIAQYHLDNTQPDNTTNQPWGIAAFLAGATTASMGIQQMHDATAQGSSSQSQNVGLVAAMLFADAAAVLSRCNSKPAKIS